MKRRLGHLAIVAIAASLAACSGETSSSVSVAPKPASEPTPTSSEAPVAASASSTTTVLTTSTSAPVTEDVPDGTTAIALPAGGHLLRRVSDGWLLVADRVPGGHPAILWWTPDLVTWDSAIQHPNAPGL